MTWLLNLPGKLPHASEFKYVLFLCIWSSSRVPGYCSQSPWNFLSVERDKVVFCYVVNEWLLEGWGLVASGANPVIQRLELSGPPPDLQGGERDSRLVQSVTLPNLINLASVMKPP